MKMGRVEAARKTMNLILTSDQGPRRITEDGRRELKRFIETNGEVVKIVRESGDSWSVVFRVKKDGLREHLKRIK
ncbi:MAG: hypothetical protein HY042_00135 [Spirochaetia bacterium]|nr:hypothetical protein [Spirochaetia bacterium]